MNANKNDFTSISASVAPLKAQLGVMLHVTPQGNETAAQTYTHFTELVQNIESLGFNEAWVTEHHFQPHSLTPNPLLMMGHFLAHTQSLKMGAAAVLLGFHNPVEVAEQLAILNTLHPQRVMCGFAKGGPFESQNKTFKTNGELSRARMEEAIPALLGLLKFPKHSHLGTYYQWQDVCLEPKSNLHHAQFMLATSNPHIIALAANYDLGLMAAQFWDIEKVIQNIESFKQQHPEQKSPDMMVARGLFIDDNPDIAKQKALAHIHTFRTQKSQLWGQHKGPMQNLNDRELLGRMLCGTPEMVRLQTQRLLDTGVTRLGLNPLTAHHECRAIQLERFITEVWPAVQGTSFLSDALPETHQVTK